MDGIKPQSSNPPGRKVPPPARPQPQSDASGVVGEQAAVDNRRPIPQPPSNGRPIEETAVPAGAGDGPSSSEELARASHPESKAGIDGDKAADKPGHRTMFAVVVAILTVMLLVGIGMAAYLASRDEAETVPAADDTSQAEEVQINPQEAEQLESDIEQLDNELDQLEQEVEQSGLEDEDIGL